MSRLGFALCALPLLGLVELGAQLWTSHRPPSFDDWYAVESALRAMRRQGDLVVVAPAWADPAARRALGDGFFPLRDAARPDESRYEHAVEISTLGERAAELSGWREEEQKAVGKFVLRRLTNPSPAAVVYDFVDHLGPAAADVRGTTPPAVCAWNEHAQVLAGGLGGHPTFPVARFECPGGVFFNVGVTVIADQDFRPRRCIWSHPFARGEIVTRFRGVPLGKTIHGHGGMYWIIERPKKGAPITLTVRVDGETIGQVVHEDGQGFAPFELPLGKHAGKEGAEVEFAVSSPNYRDRHFCFEADTR